MNKKDFRPKIKVCIRLPKITLFANPYTIFSKHFWGFQRGLAILFSHLLHQNKNIFIFKNSMYHETHIFMFGLKNEKLILLIHVVVVYIYKRTYERIDRRIDLCRCIDLRLVKSFNYLHASVFCAHSLRRLIQNLIIR